MTKKVLPYKLKSGFTVPKSYFEELEADIMDKISAEKEERSLSKLEVNSGFKVPEDYFDGLEDEIIAGINSGEKETKVIPLTVKQRFYHIAGIAACFAAIIGSLLISGDQNPSFESLELSIIEDYIESNRLDLNTNEISTFIFDEGYEIEEFSTSSLDDETLYEYLSENIDDPTMDLD